MKQPDVCSVCKKTRPCPWTCEVCELAGLARAVCSGRCRRTHERDGRHRLEAKKQSAAAAPGAPARKRAGSRVQVRIVRGKR